MVLEMLTKRIRLMELEMMMLILPEIELVEMLAMLILPETVLRLAVRWPALAAVISLVENSLYPATKLTKICRGNATAIAFATRAARPRSRKPISSVAQSSSSISSRCHKMSIGAVGSTLERNPSGSRSAALKLSITHGELGG